ncbi:baculoviral IAP repeat-containing protein 3-like isoform X1 [Mizuhopecten yessoensis]|uniref:baculoviral IAP repeat-containing protein 3-like isoform X1 n=1 Tax=Mizuhopecten yessoensis TaxID=6573 RepID=UPI000B45F670|nr:baculoviral IAP repeat-containing protein 3-like isoform X1 [Mizuhopecten yessoensis]
MGATAIKSGMDATEVGDSDDSIPEVLPRYNKTSKQGRQLEKIQSGTGVLYILVVAIFVEFLNVITKNDSKEEEIEEKVCCGSNSIEIELPIKFDLKSSSKLHSLMNDTIARMSIYKGLKNLSSEMQIYPEISLDMYPVYGPGVGPAIDLLLSTTPPPTRQELMANESLRLCTFHNYPAFRIVSCLLLAKAGFFYTGHNDEVICYSCDKSVAGWNLGSDPYKVHKENSPDCNHLRAMDTYNMSVAASAPENSTTAAEAKPDNSSTESAAKSAPSNNATSFSSKADSGYNTQTTSSEFVETAGFKFGGSAAEGNNTSVPAAEGNVTSVPAAEGKNTSVPEAEGNNTSVPAAEGNNTSVPNSVNNSSISSVGNDKNSSNVPSTIISSSLPNSSNTNTAGIQDTSTPVNNYPTQPSESTGRTPVATPVSGYKGPANPQRTRAYYPDYVLPGDRLKTFDKWPADIRQTPKQMLESGFFYAGYEDCVRCFQCGIGLRNWEPPDNPHVEHARWSPRCPFLLQAKGSDFINLVMDAVAQLEQRKNDQTAGQSTETTTQSSNNNTVVTTSENQQNSASASGSSVDNASITPSGTPTDTSNPSPSKPPSNTPAAASKATPSASQGVTAAGKDMKGTDMSNPTLSEPPSATPAAASKHTPSSSPSITAAGKDLKGAETVSTKHNITVDDVSTTNVVTGSDKAKDLTDLMKTEIVRKIKQDGYGEDNVKAALRILLDTKEATDITEAMIYDTVRKNTSVRHRRTALGGEAAAEPLSEELQRIKKENREMRERTVCKICLEDQVSIAFIPCGHLVACGHCAHAITRCAVCRKPITSKILTHMDV